MAEVQGMANKALEDFRDRAFGVVIDQHARDLIGKIVAGGTVDRPVFRQLFVATQNFLDDEINRAPVFRQRNAQSLGAAQLQFLEIFERPIKSVRMIDPQPGDRPAGDQFKKKFVRSVENLRQFNADGCEIVDIKKAAVIDFFRRHPPKREPIRLRVQ